MKHYLPFLSLALCGAVNAQPVLNASDVIPDIGPTPILRTTDYLEAGPTGANFTFDASGAVAGTSSQGQVVSVASTPYASFFPQATLATTALTNPSTYGYMSFSSTESSSWGYYGTNNHVVHSNGEKLYQFPLTNGATWTDAYAGTGSSGGQNFTRTGSVTCAYNGYGTVIMPFGTFTGVIRFEYTETVTDVFAGNLTTVTMTHSVTYIKPGVEASLFTSAEITSDFGTGGDQMPLTDYSFMVDVTEVGISELQGTGPSALLMPNPASDVVSLVMDGNTSGKVSVSLLDATGREVRVLQPLTAVPTAQNLSFDLSDVPRGIYLVRLADAQGRSTSSRLVLR